MGWAASHYLYNGHGPLAPGRHCEMLNGPVLGLAGSPTCWEEPGATRATLCSLCSVPSLFSTASRSTWPPFCGARRCCASDPRSVGQAWHVLVSPSVVLFSAALRLSFLLDLFQWPLRLRQFILPRFLHLAFTVCKYCYLQGELDPGFQILSNWQICCDPCSS